MPPRRSRRWLRWLVTAVAVVLALPLSLAGAIATRYATTAIDTTGQTDFRRPLRIPELAPSRLDAEGRRVFDLRLQEGTADLGAGPGTRTWGIDGDHLGPTLRARRGEQVLVRVTNGVGETTTLHWHGMHLPAAMDGGPHQTIPPGSTWSPSWTVDQPAATLWYHPHLHGRTAEHVHRGLVGMFLLDDDHSDRLALPDEYGVDDLPVIVQDASLDDEGQLDPSPRAFSGVGQLGERVLVNGTPTPHHRVTTERVRLRLLNASTSRTYGFGLADGSAVALVGTDGGLLPAPRTVRRVPLSPGERAEVVVTVRPGARTVLRSFPVHLSDDRFQQRFAGGDDVLDVLELRAAQRLAPSPRVPGRLAPAPDLREADAVRTRRFVLSGRSVNGLRMEHDRIDQVVPLGSTEVWDVRNADDGPHSFHVHDVQFRVLALDGAPPPPVASGWKDTVRLPGGVRARLLLRFTDHADPRAAYVFHCHLLAHEDAGMMGQFVVVPARRALSGQHEHGASPTPPAGPGA